VQRSATSHAPAAGRHVCDAPWNSSGGHVGDDPSQTSARSQGPAAARHSKPAGRPAHTTVPQSSAQTPEQHISPPAHVLARSQRPATHIAVSQPVATHVVALHGGKQPVARSAVGSLGTQALSGHSVSSGVCTQMRSMLQVSTVHATPSSQSEGPLQPMGASSIGAASTASPASPASLASRPDASSADASIPPASMSSGRAMHPMPGRQTCPVPHASSLPVSRQMPATHDGATHDVVLAQSAAAPHCGRGHEGSVPSTQLGRTHVPATQVSSPSQVTDTQLRLTMTFAR
jgi:hypothetical protein